MAKKAKKEKKKKRETVERVVVVRRPRVPLTALDVLTALVAGVFLAISLVSAGYSLRAAIFGEDDPAARRREDARLAAEQAAAADISGAIWFSQPDGTFLTGESLRPVAPAAEPREAAPAET